MKIKEKWVAWEELLPGFTPFTTIDFQQVGGLAPGSIPFADATGFLTQDNANFFWDETNARLGIGIGAPLVRAHIRGAACADYAGIHPDTILLLENDDNVSIQLQCATDGEAWINFADDDFNPPAGQIEYDFADGEMTFSVERGQAMKLEVAGMLVSPSADAPTNPLYVYDDGTDEGGLAGNNEVVARFQQRLNAHTGLSIDAKTVAYDPCLFLAKAGEAYWDIRCDASDADKFNIRYQGGGVANRTDFIIDATGNVFITTGYLAIRGQEELRFYDNGNYVGFEAPALGADQIWVLPNADAPAANQCLMSDSAGNLDWSQALGAIDSPTFAGLTVSGAINNGIFSVEVTDNYVWSNAIPPGFAGAVSNILIGKDAGDSITSADYNVLIGELAGTALTTQGANIVIGYRAGEALIAVDNVLIGAYAGLQLTTGPSNFALGTESLKLGAGGQDNVAVGVGALKNSGAQSRNIAIGSHAGINQSTGSDNVYIGYYAGESCDGQRNVYIGRSAGQLCSTGGNNVAIGYGAGQGLQAGVPQFNTSIGYYSGANLGAGDNNTFLGAYAGNDVKDGTGNVCIGYYAGETNLVDGNNQLWIANSNTATPLIYGEFPNTLLRIQATGFEVIGTAKLGDGGTTNYANVAADGTITLLGTAKVTKKVFLSNAAFTKGGTAPVQVILGNLNGWEFDIGDDAVMTSILPDDWDPTTDIIIKACWYIDEAYAVDKEIQWRVDWSALPHDFSETVDAPTHSGFIESGDINIPAVAKRMGSSTVGTIVAASLSAGDMLGFKISRIAVTEDDPTAKPTIHHLILQYTADRIGT